MKYYGIEMEAEHPYGYEEMTWKDAEEVEELNRECGWSFGLNNTLRLLADHMDACDCENRGIPRNEAKRTMEKIEWRLKDANFHTFANALHTFDYNKALEIIVDEFTVGGDK